MLCLSVLLLTVQSSAGSGYWKDRAYLCDTGIGNLTTLQKRIGARYEGILQVGNGYTGEYEILVRRGHVQAGLSRMVQLSRQYGYVLVFPNGRRFYPDKGWRRKKEWETSPNVDFRIVH